MTGSTIAVIGAGPYGLAAAAFLRERGSEHHVFGVAMEFWASHMPKGMILRSPWNASNIGDPRGELTLDAYEAELGVPLSQTRDVALDVFIGYGRWFQAQSVPDLDKRRIMRIALRSPRGYELQLDDGETVPVARVVVAAGLLPFAYVPHPFAQVDSPRVRHSSGLADPADFAGRDVAVVGAGQSALESAALLVSSGAKVEVIVRQPTVRWRRRRFVRRPWSVFGRFAYAPSMVGPGGISWLSESPTLLRRLPPRARTAVDRLAMVPEADRPLLARLTGARITGEATVTAIEDYGDTIELTLDDGTTRRLDDVVLATGYRVDVGRYEFLDKSILAGLACVDGYPVLRPGFESSQPGLHFIGASAAWTFGPLMRFVAGSRYAAASLSAAIAGPRRSRRRSGFRGGSHLAATRD